MYEQQLKLIETSYQTALANQSIAALAETFFERFFSQYPETQSYFAKTDIAYFGPKKLNIIYEFVVDTLAHPDYAEVGISEEVIRHQIYGLKDKSYYYFLVDTLSEVIIAACEQHEQFNEIKQAWELAATGFKGSVQTAANTYLE